MATKRQQTMAKIERERNVREKRARKQEKKLQRKLAASGAGDQPVEETPLDEVVGETPLDEAVEEAPLVRAVD